MLAQKEVAVPVGPSLHADGASHTPMETGIVAAIDVGTTKVCTILGRRSGKKGIQVLGHSTVPCSGLRKGNVTDVAATEEAVRESISQVEQATGHRIESAFVGITGSHVSFENRRDRLETVGKSEAITADDLSRAPESLAAAASDPGRRLLHAVRMSYSLDGDEGIRNPLGMHSRDIEVETHVVTGGVAFINRLVRAVEKAGITVAGLVLEPLASGLAVLTPEEKERGAMLVDMGGGTTDVVGFKRGRICYTGVIPVGGYQFTNDISLTFNTSYQAAEAAKLKYAGTELQASSSDQEISLPVIGREADVRVSRMDICQVTRERAQELARMIKLLLSDAQLGDPADISFVLTGGASNLPGLPALIQRTLAIPVRHGVPNVRGAIPDELKDPAYATSVGILVWVATEYAPRINAIETNGNQSTEAASRNGYLSGLLRKMGGLVPFGLFAARKGRI